MEKFSYKEQLTSYKMNKMVDAVNNNEEANNSLAEAFQTASERIEGNLSTILDLLGLYSDRTPITLTASQTGKAILPLSPNSLYGRMAAYSGASVSKEYSVTRGDMLLIRPGKTSNELFTVSQVVTSADGTKVYRKVISLNEIAELAIDGKLRYLVMPSDMVIVVTYFPALPDFNETIEVKSCAAFRTISTQVGNIYTDLEQNYMKIGGFYGNTGVGYADSLMTPADADLDTLSKATELFPATRPLNDANSLLNGTLYPTAEGFAPHTKLPDDAKSQISFESVGGDVLGGNQMAEKTNPAEMRAIGGTTRVLEDGSVEMTPTSGNCAFTSPCQKGNVGDKIMSLVIVKTDEPTEFIFGISYVFNMTNKSTKRTTVGNGQYETLYGILSPATYENATGSVKLLTAEKVWIMNKAVHLNLTTLFPTPSGQTFVANLTNNQASAIAVANRLGYFCYLTK